MLLNFKMIAVDKVAEGVEYLEQICYDVGQKPYQWVMGHVASRMLSER